MGPLTLGEPGITPIAVVQAQPGDATRAQIQITLTPTAAEDLVEALTGTRPDLSSLPGVPLTPMDLTLDECTAVAGWSIRFLFENAGQTNATFCRALADAFDEL